MFELEINWDDYLPPENPERVTFASRRNRLIADWWKTTAGKVTRSAIKNQLQTFRFELREDYESFQELLESLQS